MKVRAAAPDARMSADKAATFIVGKCGMKGLKETALRRTLVCYTDVHLHPEPLYISKKDLGDNTLA